MAKIYKGRRKNLLLVGTHLDRSYFLNKDTQNGQLYENYPS